MDRRFFSDNLLCFVLLLCVLSDVVFALKTTVVFKESTDKLIEANVFGYCNQTGVFSISTSGFSVSFLSHLHKSTCVRCHHVIYEFICIS